MGCPIRKSTDRSLFAAPRGLSQRTTSFIASCHQGIHQMPLSRLIALIINAHPSAEDAKQKPQRASFLLLPIQLTLIGGALTKRPDHSEKNPASVRSHPMANRLLLAQNQANPLFTIFQKIGSLASHNRSDIPETCFPTLPTKWWSLPGSNRRPEACKATALPAELRPRNSPIATPYDPIRMVGLGRVELPTSRLSGVRSNHLSYRPGSRFMP